MVPPPYQIRTLCKLFCLCVLLLGFTNYSFAQSINKKKWYPVNTPIYTDLTSLFVFDTNSAVASGKQIIIYSNNKWKKLQQQPYNDINEIFALDTNSVYISSSNKYQESQLYHWDGNMWNLIYHPLASTISSMYFVNESYGIIAGLGEIAVYDTGNWKLLPPPSIEGLTTVKVDNNEIIWALSISGNLYKYDSNWEIIITDSKIRHIEQFKNDIYVLADNYLGIIDNNKIEKSIISDSLQLVNSFSIADSDKILAIGDNGLILHYYKKKWTSKKSGLSAHLNDGYCDGNHGWIIGNRGNILRYSSEIPKYNPVKWKGFDQSTHRAHAKIIDDEYGVASADFNNDGLIDIFVCGLFEDNHLYINKGGFLFLEEAEKWNITGIPKDKAHLLNLGCSAADIDNDGDIDLYVTVLNGKNKLYENMNGKDFFEYSRITGGVGKDSDRTNSCIFGDVDNDGDVDCFITNEYSTNRLYLNNSVGVFEEVTFRTGLETENGGVGCTFGDIDNDGDIDLYVTNWSKKNILYKNMFIESGVLSFEDITDESNTGGEVYTKSNGVIFRDVDNDADLDLFVANRKTSNRLYINNGNGIFSDTTQYSLGIDSLKTNGVALEDFDGDGFIDIYLANVGENVLYKGMKNNNFKNCTSEYGAQLSGYSTGVSTADFDNDGDVDIYSASFIDGSHFFINNLNTKNYIQLKIEGVTNNRDAIGTKLYTYKSGYINQEKFLVSYRQLTAGSGYSSMNSLIQTIPIQDNKYVDVSVLYPNGNRINSLHISAGSVVNISEINGWEKNLKRTKQWLQRRVLDPHELFELIKWLFVIFSIVFSMSYGRKKYNLEYIDMLPVSVVLLFIYFYQYYYHEYKQFIYSTLMPIISIIGLLSLLHLFFERKKIKMISLIEQDQIRTKLSRDLHDDLASTINTIGIYLTLIRYNVKKPQDKFSELIDKTEHLVSNAASSITDLIWAINPKSEKIENLLLRIQKNFSFLLKEKNIKFTIEIDKAYGQIVLQAKTKQNIFLIVKEAMNNVLKYANPQNLKLQVLKNKEILSILILDDGIGFDIKEVQNKGHGLNNMQNRAKEIGAKLVLKTKKNIGTSIELELRFIKK